MGEIQAVQDNLSAGADVAALSRHGFNALQSAAIGANTTPVEQNLAVLTLLVQAGSALFLAAEFAPTTDAVRLLLDAGAEADVTSSGI